MLRWSPRNCQLARWKVSLVLGVDWRRPEGCVTLTAILDLIQNLCFVTWKINDGMWTSCTLCEALHKITLKQVMKVGSVQQSALFMSCSLPGLTAEISPSPLWPDSFPRLTKHSNPQDIHWSINPHFSFLRVVKFRRTGESSRSEEDAISGEHEIQIEGVRTELEAIELEDGAAVPKEFANPTDGERVSCFPSRKKMWPLHFSQDKCTGFRETRDPQIKKENSNIGKTAENGDLVTLSPKDFFVCLIWWGIQLSAPISNRTFG